MDCTNSTFKGKLSLIDESLFFKRPLENLHSVAEIITHLTFWRNEAIKTIENRKGNVTEESYGNWLSDDELIGKGRNNIITDYNNSLTELINLLQQKDDSFLSEKYEDIDFGGQSDFFYLINGMLHHDLYHLGQLGIIIAFLKANDKQTNKLSQNSAGI